MRRGRRCIVAVESVREPASRSRGRYAGQEGRSRASRLVPTTGCPRAYAPARRGRLGSEALLTNSPLANALVKGLSLCLKVVRPAGGRSPVKVFPTLALHPSLPPLRAYAPARALPPLIDLLQGHPPIYRLKKTKPMAGRPKTRQRRQELQERNQTRYQNQNTNTPKHKYLADIYAEKYTTFD